MPAAKYDLHVETGATFRLSFVYGRRTGATDVDGNPVVEPYDLTGCTARMQIRQSIGRDVLVQADTDAGIVIDGPAGRIVVTLTDEQTATLVVRRGVYDLEVEYPSGDVVRVLEGKVTISANVTR
jgi:hypothetical protein